MFSPDPLLPPTTASHTAVTPASSAIFGFLTQPTQTRMLAIPLVIFFHGGWWKSAYDLNHAGHLSKALRDIGIAVWSVEYRRVGATGGGWPNTFLDAAAGVDFVAELSKTYPLDTSRVIAMGHSAGGHLAFWTAGRHHIDPKSELFLPQPQVSLRGTIALAGAVDLRLTIELSTGIFDNNQDNVTALMGGLPKQHPDRYKAGNPGELLPFNIPQILIQGTDDDQIPSTLPTRWSEQARHAGDRVNLRIIPGADHLDMIDPQSAAWPIVRESVQSLLK